jgi:hypothetical protein
MFSLRSIYVMIPLFDTNLLTLDTIPRSRIYTVGETKDVTSEINSQPARASRRSWTG